MKLKECLTKFVNLAKSILKSKYLLLSISTAILITSFVFYFINFNGTFSNNQNDWGSFGSYVGGLVGSLLSFINIILITITLRMQIESSNENRKDKEIQSIVNQIDQYFKLLSDNISEEQFAFECNNMEQTLNGGSTIEFVINRYFKDDRTNKIYIIENVIILLDKLRKIDENTFNFNLNRFELMFKDLVKKYLILAINSNYYSNKVLLKKYLFWYISVDPEILIKNCRQNLRELLDLSRPDGEYDYIEWK